MGSENIHTKLKVVLGNSTGGGGRWPANVGVGPDLVRLRQRTPTHGPALAQSMVWLC